MKMGKAKNLWQYRNCHALLGERETGMVSLELLRISQRNIPTHIPHARAHTYAPHMYTCHNIHTCIDMPYAYITHYTHTHPYPHPHHTYTCTPHIYTHHTQTPPTCSLTHAHTGIHTPPPHTYTHTHTPYAYTTHCIHTSHIHAIHTIHTHP